MHILFFKQRLVFLWSVNNKYISISVIISQKHLYLDSNMQLSEFSGSGSAVLWTDIHHGILFGNMFGKCVNTSAVKLNVISFV